MTIESKCLLRHICTLAGDSKACTDRCAHYVAMSGRITNVNTPTDYALNTLESSSNVLEMAGVYKHIRAYIKTLERQFNDDTSNVSDRIKSLYLFSESPGTGKTTTASVILNSYLTIHYIGSLKRNRQPLQRPAYFFDVNESQTLFNTFNRPRVPNEIAEPAAAKYYKALNIAKQAPFVVMDDVGVRENITDAFRGDLHDLINHRVSNRMPTVYTSNIPIEELATVYDARLYDRIRDLCAVIQFNGNSGRGMRK